MTHLVQAPPAALVVAEPDRRFYAFVIDRLIAWVVYAAAAVGAWMLFLKDGPVVAGALLIAVVVVAVWLVGALMTGIGGATPGKSFLGLRVVSVETGRPVGLGSALLRQTILGVTTIPTLGLGTAMLAWMASMDPTGHRRGWHDTVAHTVVVDVRPAPQQPDVEAPAPRRIVNLTTMRLMPAPATPAPEPVPEPVRFEPATFTGSQPIQMPAALAPTDRPAPPQPMPRHASQPVPAPPVPAPPAPAPPAPQPAMPARPVTQPPVSQPGGVPPTTRWRVTFDTGESFVVDGLALVGRGPEPQSGEQVSHLVALSSTDMSLSKTHAQFQVVPDGTLVVMDRGSTNGTTLIRQGAARPLGARRPATLIHGDRVRFGDREMQVVRES